MSRGGAEEPPDAPLWVAIRRASGDLGWDSYATFLERALGGGAAGPGAASRSPKALPFPGVEPYRLLKAATEVFLAVNCSGTGSGKALPSLDLIRRTLEGRTDIQNANPRFLELIWCYWHEEGMLVPAMEAIGRRFQNLPAPGGCDPLVNLDVDPLRPLASLLWGWVQDEPHRLSSRRRAYEYDHHYGLRTSSAGPLPPGPDSRAGFVEAFHRLLHACAAFFEEDDDTTVVADGLPLRHALRDVHVLLGEGAHNQFGDLPWTARQEMLIQQWLLARPEMREALPGRVMVAHPEPWMDRLQSARRLLGWTDTPAIHFRDLATFGERILLGARLDDWGRAVEPGRSAAWARFWRPEIQGYLHAYRAVTGVDLSQHVDGTSPSDLLRRGAAPPQSPPA